MIGPDLARQYHSLQKRRLLWLGLGFLLLLGLVLVAASSGSIRVPFGEVVQSLLGLGEVGRIVREVRLPRILAALLAGAGLAVSGTVMQSVLRNSLASPYTLGLSSAAAFGAAFAVIVLGAGTGNANTIELHNPLAVGLCAFGFSLVSTLFILLLAAFTNLSADSIILAGIAVSAICTAGLTLMQYLADSVQLSIIVSWSFGDLGRANRDNLLVTSAVYFAVSFLLFALRWDLNALAADETVARSVGVRTSLVRVVGMIAASLLSAVIVSYFGIIAFIGLLGPHIARRLFGAEHRVLLVASPLVGASVLLAADTLARTLFAPMVLPVGVLTSMLGGPLFISLLMARYRR